MKHPPTSKYLFVLELPSPITTLLFSSKGLFTRPVQQFTSRPQGFELFILSHWEPFSLNVDKIISLLNKYVMRPPLTNPHQPTPCLNPPDNKNPFTLKLKQEWLSCFHPFINPLAPHPTPTVLTHTSAPPNIFIAFYPSIQSLHIIHSFQDVQYHKAQFPVHSCVIMFAQDLFIFI